MLKNIPLLYILFHIFKNIVISTLYFIQILFFFSVILHAMHVY